MTVCISLVLISHMLVSCDSMPIKKSQEDESITFSCDSLLMSKAQEDTPVHSCDLGNVLKLPRSLHTLFPVTLHVLKYMYRIICMKYFFL